MDFKEKLKKEIEECFFKDFKEHIQKDAVLILDKAQDILEMANAIAIDDVKKISKAIEDKTIIKAVIDDIEKYQEKTFKFIIVSPFVIVQEK